MASKLGLIVADFETQLTTKIAVGGTSATLLSATDADGVALAAGRYFFTIDGDNSQKEYFSCALSGTALTSLCSISRQGVEISGAVREHRVGASVKITDHCYLKYLNNLYDGTDKIDGSKPLEYDVTPTLTLDNQVVTKKYMDDLVLLGASIATEAVYGVSKLSVAAANAVAPIVVGDNDPRLPTEDEKAALDGTGTPAAGNKFVTADTISKMGDVKTIINAGFDGNGATLPVPVFQHTTDGQLYACDGNDASKLNFLGFVISNSTSGNPATLQTEGIVPGFTNLTKGVKYYVQDAVGTIGVTPGVYAILVGMAISTTEILIINDPLPSRAEYVVASNSLKMSSDAQHSDSDTGALAMIKEIQMHIGGTIRIKHTAWATGSYNAETQVFINGVAAGTLRSTYDHDGTMEYTEDLAVKAFDKVQLYLKSNTGTTAYASNFRLYFDFTTSAKGCVLNTD